MPKSKPSQSCKSLCPSQTGYVDRDGGVKLFYRIYGSPQPNKPVMVFVHGEDSDSRVWKCQQKAFCHCYQTLALDQRGFGKSSKVGPLTIETHREDLHYMLTSLNLLTNQIILVGWSMGGLVAQSYILTYPQDVQKLVLVDTGPQVVSSDQFPYGRSKEEEAEILYLIATDFPRYTIEGVDKTYPETCPGINEIREQAAVMIVETGKDITLRQTIDSTLFSSVDRLSQIQAPTLIFVGLKDNVLPPQASMFMNLHIPNSQMFQFPDAGHGPFLTFKKTFNQQLYKFVIDATYPCQLCKHFLDE
jgi:pimeloyl-ACP methyl ester carboxylesterase